VTKLQRLDFFDRVLLDYAQNQGPPKGARLAAGLLEGKFDRGHPG
jgi:hypothetical protein